VKWGWMGDMRRFLEGPQAYNCRAWARSRVHLRWTRLDGEGGASGWCCGLSAGVGVAVSVAGWLGR
jgi:hypothetical protein